MNYFLVIASTLLHVPGVYNAPVEPVQRIESYSLYDDIFRSYNAHIRPVNNKSTQLVVKVVFRLSSISELRERNQVLVSSGYVLLEWDDLFLGWNETDYDGLDNIVVPQSLVWRPDIVVDNSLQATGELGFNELPIRIGANGHIRWSPSFFFNTHCEINVRLYPFDTQVCIITLETMASHESEITIKLTSDRDILMNYNPNGQWDITDFKLLEVSENNQRSQLDIALTLKRRRSFYILNIICPVILLSFLGNLVFALPADAGEKISLSVTILLAYVVFLTIVSSSMPETSMHSSLLAIYLTMLVALSSLSVVFTTLVLRIHHKDPSIPVPALTAKATQYGRSVCRHWSSKQHQNSQNTVSPGCVEKETEKLEDEAVTWRDVAKFIDNVLFWVYLVTTVLSSVLFLGIMANS